MQWRHEAVSTPNLFVYVTNGAFKMFYLLTYLLAYVAAQL